MQEKDTKMKMISLRNGENLGNHQHYMKMIRENKGSLMVKLDLLIQISQKNTFHVNIVMESINHQS